jgi:hypothetical protein
VASGWQTDKRWSDRFIPQLKLIVADFLIAPANERLDQEENTDLIVLDASAKTVACRVRRYKYLEKYSGEFTVRSKRASGAQTELTKIIAGWGDYLLYAFTDAEEKGLILWHIVDLNSFRLWFNRYMAHNYGIPPGEEQPNGDGSSSFRAFRLAELPEGVATTQQELEAARELVGARAVTVQEGT